jgi:hypothetical protein
VVQPVSLPFRAALTVSLTVALTVTRPALPLSIAVDVVDGVAAA